MYNEEASAALELAIGGHGDAASRLQRCLQDMERLPGDVERYGLTPAQTKARRGEIIAAAALDNVSITDWDGTPAPPPPPPPEPEPEPEVEEPEPSP